MKPINEYYPTPAPMARACVLALREHVDNPVRPLLLDVCAGGGEFMREWEGRTVGIDLQPAPSLAVDWHQADALTFPWPFADAIICNPPFSQAEQFVHRALGNVARPFGLFARLTFLQSLRRYRTIFSPTPPNRVLVFDDRIHWQAGQDMVGRIFMIWTGETGDTKLEWRHVDR